MNHPELTYICLERSKRIKKTNPRLMADATAGSFEVLAGVTVSTERRVARAAVARSSALSEVVVKIPLVSLNAHNVTMRDV
jgi:hypothetical protein